jgi:hypothetical protein
MVTSGLASTALVLMTLPPAAFVTVYVRTLYPALVALFTTLTGWTFVPLGISTLPLLTGIVLWRWLAPRRFTGAGRSPTTEPLRPSRPFASRLAGPALLAVALGSSYLIVWGANYRRPPLLAQIDVAASGGASSPASGQAVSARDGESPPTQAEFEALAEELLVWIVAGASSLAQSEAALRAVSLELELLTEQLGTPTALPHRIKLLPPGTLLRAGYAGMLFPFTLEPQVDAGLSHASRVSVGAHELAHAAGFASEADADLAAVIAGLRARDPFARYATALSLMARMMGSLPGPVRGSLLARLPERAEADLSEARLRAARYLLPSFASRVTAIYDRLLRGQGVGSGVSEYGLTARNAVLARRRGLLPAPVPAAETADQAQRTQPVTVGR